MCFLFSCTSAFSAGVNVLTDKKLDLDKNDVTYHFPEATRQKFKQIHMGNIIANDKDLTVRWLFGILNERLSKSDTPWKFIFYIDANERKTGLEMADEKLSRFPRFLKMNRKQILAKLSEVSVEEIVYYLRSDVGGGIAIMGKTIVISPSF